MSVVQQNLIDSFTIQNFWLYKKNFIFYFIIDVMITFLEYLSLQRFCWSREEATKVRAPSCIGERNTEASMFLNFAFIKFQSSCDLT